MKRLHVHVKAQADQFDRSVSFYETLFGAPPTKARERYAKWMLEDPRVNFVVEATEDRTGADQPGVHHLGLQVDEPEELAAIGGALKRAAEPLLEVGETVCCFSRSEKSWTADPAGVRWEAFRTFGETTQYGDQTAAERAAEACGAS